MRDAPFGASRISVRNPVCTSDMSRVSDIMVPKAPCNGRDVDIAGIVCSTFNPDPLRQRIIYTMNMNKTMQHLWDFIKPE